MSAYDKYYLNQAGGSCPRNSEVAVKGGRYQQGGGLIGSLLLRGARFVATPIFKIAGRELLSEGLDYGKRIIENYGEKPLRNLLAEQVGVSKSNLKKKLVNKLVSLQSGGSRKRVLPLPLEDSGDMKLARVANMTQSQFKRKKSRKSKKAKGVKKPKRKTNKKKKKKGSKKKKKTSKFRIKDIFD